MAAAVEHGHCDWMFVISDLEDRYESVRQPHPSDPASMFGDWVAKNVESFVSGEVGFGIFGSEMDSLDAVALVSLYEKKMDFVLLRQITAALAEGHSWNRIAAAMGVSRQAARKRFRADFPSVVAIRK